jgi:hypothetical protein
MNWRSACGRAHHIEQILKMAKTAEDSARIRRWLGE